MSIWDTVSNVGQTIANAADRAMDTMDDAVKFVSELPPSETPAVTYKCGVHDANAQIEDLIKKLTPSCHAKFSTDYIFLPIGANGSMDASSLFRDLGSMITDSLPSGSSPVTFFGGKAAIYVVEPSADIHLGPSDPFLIVTDNTGQYYFVISNDHLEANHIDDWQARWYVSASELQGCSYHDGTFNRQISDSYIPGYSLLSKVLVYHGLDHCQNE